MATVTNEAGCETRVWGTISEAIGIIGCSDTSLRKYRALGLVRVQKLPGMRPMLNLDDCRKIARRLYEPAPGDIS